MNFDHTLQNGDIDYGFVKGGSSLVFIKVGLGGNCSGYENKYLEIAFRLKEKYGCSVIVASNPNDGKKHAESDRQVIGRFAQENAIERAELFFFGHSNGGIKGLELADCGVNFRKMVLVNMPLMINFHKTKRYISAIPETEILAVYGEHDPSFPYVPFIEGKFENTRVLRAPGADHNFKGMLEEFICLSELLLN